MRYFRALAVHFFSIFYTLGQNGQNDYLVNGHKLRHSCVVSYCSLKVMGNMLKANFVQKEQTLRYLRHKKSQQFSLKLIVNPSPKLVSFHFSHQIILNPLPYQFTLIWVPTWAILESLYGTSQIVFTQEKKLLEPNNLLEQVKILDKIKITMVTVLIKHRNCNFWSCYSKPFSNALKCF